MKLRTYFDRIGFTGTPRPDLETLTAIHRGHLLNIPYENLDVQLGRRVDLDIERIYRKMVRQGRGGWCYEMNGLLDWALREVGFKVTRVNGGVRRSVLGDAALGNHVVLLIELDDMWIADVGFGDGFFDPIPLRPATIEQRGFHYRLEALDDGFWRFHNHEQGGAPSFDFRVEPADEELFASRCDYLQTSPESRFVLSLVCQRFVEGGYEIQLGRVAKRVSAGGVESWLVNDADELLSRLRTAFGLDLPEAAALWPQIVEAHERRFEEGKGGFAP
jgi:N-hydroxyarylamine O-acetyltransferase